MNTVSTTARRMLVKKPRMNATTKKVNNPIIRPAYLPRSLQSMSTPAPFAASHSSASQLKFLQLSAWREKRR